MVKKLLRKLAKKPILLVIVNLIATVFLIIFIEGLASCSSFILKVLASKRMAESYHSEYDPELGWVNKTGVSLKDFYGTGRSVSINNQRLRNRVEFSKDIPENTIRIICSGDSFTFGFGVDNDSTWCHRLEQKDPRLEVINMGLGGYGVDQAYLRYQRNYRRFDHSIHIFAFVTDDFSRMETEKFMGYDKPKLEVQNNSLIKKNVPVPRPSPLTLFLVRNRSHIHNLYTVRAVDKVRALLRPAATSTNSREKRSSASIRPVVAKVLEDLRSMSRELHATLILLHLPVYSDYQDSASDYWRNAIKEESSDQRISYIDMVDDFGKLAPEDISSLFIREGEVTFPGAAGHYNEKGNALIANLLFEKLSAVPELARYFISKKLE